MSPVQNAMLGMILGATFVGLTMVAVRNRHGGWRGVAMQLAMGALIGAAAALVAVAVREDLIADDVEVFVGGAALTGIAVVAIVAARRQRSDDG
jgi:ABC-type uncharacterized transport system permease subunit